MAISSINQSRVQAGRGPYPQKLALCLRQARFLTLLATFLIFSRSAAFYFAILTSDALHQSVIEISACDNRTAWVILWVLGR